MTLRHPEGLPLISNDGIRILAENHAILHHIDHIYVFFSLSHRATALKSL